MMLYSYVGLRASRVHDVKAGHAILKSPAILQPVVEGMGTGMGIEIEIVYATSSRDLHSMDEREQQARKLCCKQR